VNIEALQALVTEWRELAADQQRTSDLFAKSDPGQSSVARGRARQLIDCADDVQKLIHGAAS